MKRQARSRDAFSDPSKGGDYEVNRLDACIATTIRRSMKSLFLETVTRRNLTQKSGMEEAMRLWIEHPPENRIERLKKGQGPKDDPFVHFKIRINSDIKSEFLAAVKRDGCTQIQAINESIMMFRSNDFE